MPIISDPNATVPGLFSRRSINLLIGTPKSGRTRFALTAFEQYMAESKFIDYDLHPAKSPEQVGAIVCSRTFDAMVYKLQSMGLDELQAPRRFPIEPWTPEGSYEEGLELMEKAYRRLCDDAGRPVRLLYIEGFQMLYQEANMNNQYRVSEHYKKIQGFCLRNDCTILGSVGSAKTKAGESYPVLSHRILGSIQWGESADTLIGLTAIDAHKTPEMRTGDRILHIQPSGIQDRVEEMKFDVNGRLYLRLKHIENMDTSLDAQLDNALREKAIGEEFTRKEAVAWGDRLDISSRKVDSWLADQLFIGFLDKRGKTSSAVYWRKNAN